MEIIQKKYILDKKKQKVAVQIPIEEFEKIEQLLEDYALGQFINANSPEENLSLEDAKKYYQQLKNQWL